MATTTFSLSNALGTSGTQTYLNTWGAAIVTALTAIGLVQTSDTGQVNWSSGQPTVVTGTGGTNYGFQIWRFNDTLQSTKPIFIKVTYEQGSTAGVLYLQVQIASGTNGAGTLTGTISSALNMSSNGSQYSGYTGVTCYGSGDGSYAWLALDAAASSATPGAGFFYIDRTRDLTGAATSEGAVFGGESFQTTTSTFGIDFLSFTTNISGASSSTSVAAAMPLTALASSMAAGTTVYVASSTIVANGKLLPPSLAAVGYFSGDTTALTTISVNISGSAHTYLPLGAGTQKAGLGGNGAVALRYE